MKLSDSEKRDICNLIEKGQNIPEKYRFLLFDESKQIELKWNGKSDEVSNIVLPFQIIEQIDEPRTEDLEYDQGIFNLLEGRQETGWTNKLIWGENKYILSSLKNGPMRDEIEKEGGIKLIYIDPPFDVGANFSMNIDVGENSYEKQPNVLEEIAYRDTWGLGSDSFLSMIYERLLLMKDLMHETALIYVHCDYRLNASLRLVMEEIFGKDNFVNEIIWKRTNNPKGSQFKERFFGVATDTILLFAKSPKYEIDISKVKRALNPEEIKKKYNRKDEKGRYYPGPIVRSKSMGLRPTLVYEYQGYTPPPWGWRLKKEDLIKLDQKGNLGWTENGNPFRKLREEDDEGAPIYNLWDEIKRVSSPIYPTQKPNTLLERIILSSSKENDLICDFFAGSGVLAEVAERNNRKWICSDLGKFAIHTTKKRMINVQRSLKKESKNWRSFEVLNLGKYQREYFLENEYKQNELVKINNKKIKINDFENLLFKAYKANRISGFKTLHGKKGDDFVSIGPVNQPLSRNHVEEVINECVKNKVISVHILGFEYEMGLFPTIQEEAKSKGIRLLYKQIPIDIFDKRAVQKGEVIFYDVAYIDFKYHIENEMLSVELLDFAVFYNEENFNISEKLRPGRSKIVVEQGQIIEKTKSKDDLVQEKLITKHWHDWIDYWSVDFDYESKKEFIKSFDEKKNVIEKWTGNYVFENEWQSFRSSSLNNKLEFKTSKIKTNKKNTKIAVKVVDIFGNDTMKVVEVRI